MPPIIHCTEYRMSEPKPNIPLSSQQSASVSEDKSKLSTSVIESDNSPNVKPSASKIFKPTEVKLLVATPAPKIGRLCNSIPKPAVPSYSAANVYEADENAIPHCGNGRWSHDRKMSSGSVLSDSSRKSDESRKKKSSDASMSPDSFTDYWKSDFEPRRASDASVVLTEDTDQFIIGDRVWVGGVKPGQIAYIGETQFAPGEWAGVVLDEPIGKNDGTVANIRYFQCEPKKGIFSRLTRLTRYPLSEGGAGEPSASKLGPSETRRSNGNLSASLPKKSPLVLPSPTASKTSLPKASSPDSSSQPSVHVGDRVIVKSSQGSKAGVLRYLGTTDFAAGEWCGVELDDPLGKNDGSVSGTRYFECRPKFGLFAPLHKVSKSPANKRPSQGNCVIHSRGGVATPGVRRHGSKESLTSLSSAASAAASVRSSARKVGVRTPTTPTSAKNALQETLKEKELHIEQLLKERDLERAEVTRAASQADEAERRLAALRQEFEQQKEEAEARLSDLDTVVCLLRAENEELRNLLEDERKKCEDLQFRYEEESIEKADIKAVSEKAEEKMKMLEKALFEERRRMDTLELESNKLFEAEEQMVMVKEELEAARGEVAELKKKLCPMEQERISLEAQLTSARAEMETLKMENESLKASSGEELAKVIKALEDQRAEAERLTQMVATTERSAADKEKELHAKYLKIVNEVTAKLEAQSGNLTAQLEESKSLASEKIKMLEAQLEEKVEAYSSLESRLSEVEVVLKNAEEMQSRMKEAEELLEKALGEKEQMSVLRGEAESRRQEAEALLMEKQKQLERMSEEMSRTKSEFEAKRRELDTLSESREESLRTEMKRQEEMETGRRAEAERLNAEVKAVRTSLSAREEELRSEREKRKELEEKMAKLDDKWRRALEENDRLDILLGDKGREAKSLTEKLSQMSSQKEKLEKDISGFMNSSNDYSAQLLKMNEEQRSKEREVEALREDVSRLMQSAERKEQELQKALEKKEVEGKALREELEEERERARAAEERIKAIEAKGVKERRLAEEEAEGMKKILAEIKSKAEEREQSLQQKMQEMSGERDRLLQMLEDCKRELSRGEEARMDKEKEAEACEREKEKLDREVKEATEKLAAAKEELMKATEEQKKLNEEKLNLEKARGALEERVNHLETKYTELEMKLGSTKNQNEVLNETLIQLRKEKCEVEKDVAEKTRYLEVLRSRAEVAETLRSARELDSGVAIDRLEAEAGALRALVKEAQDRSEKAEAALESERGRCDRLEEQMRETERREKEERKALEGKREEAERVAREREREVEDLRAELKMLKRQKENITKDNGELALVLMSERAEMQKKLEDMKPFAEKIQTEGNAQDARQRQLEEEREFQKGQVDFLNSVIVDMQKKNDALKARIEILEMGFSPEDVDEFNLHNITTRSVAPRLFCDICDRFDLHDTEDCPTQASDDLPPPKSSKAKPPPPERPYCDICEVFGHDTADCDDGETF